MSSDRPPQQPLQRRRSSLAEEKMDDLEWDQDMTWLMGGAAALTIERVNYRILDSHVTEFHNDIPLISIATSVTNQALVVLDPSRAYLKKKALDLREQVDAQASIYRVLDDTIGFVRGKNCFDVKPKQTDNDEMVDKFCADNNHWMAEYKQVPVIRLEEFIKDKTGECRQYAPFTAFLLNDLIQNNLLPPGQVFVYRDTVPYQGGTIGHLWVIYKPFQAAATHGYYDFYSVDTLYDEQAYNVLKNRALLEKNYGKPAIDYCVNRYNRSDLESVSYKAVNEKIQKEFILTILNASKENCRKFLNHQYRLGALIEIEKELQKRYSRHENYNAVLEDMDRVFKTDRLHKVGYEIIHDPEDKTYDTDDEQQFILGLLCKSESQRREVLDDQEKVDLELILEALLETGPDKQELYQQFDAYRTVLDDINNRISNKIKDEVKQIHEQNHYHELKAPERKKFVIGLFVKSKDERSLVLDKQNAEDLNHLKKSLQRQVEGGTSNAKDYQLILGQVNDKLERLHELSELVNLIQNTLFTGNFKMSEAIPVVSLIWRPGQQITTPTKEKIRVPDSIDRINKRILMYQESHSIDTLKQLISLIKETAIAEQNRSSYDRDRDTTGKFLEILADDEPDEWSAKLKDFYKKLTGKEYPYESVNIQVAKTSHGKK